MISMWYNVRISTPAKASGRNLIPAFRLVREQWSEWIDRFCSCFTPAHGAGPVTGSGRGKEAESQNR